MLPKVLNNLHTKCVSRKGTEEALDEVSRESGWDKRPRNLIARFTKDGARFSHFVFFIDSEYFLMRKKCVVSRNHSFTSALLIRRRSCWRLYVTGLIISLQMVTTSEGRLMVFERKMYTAYTARLQKAGLSHVVNTFWITDEMVGVINCSGTEAGCEEPRRVTYRMKTIEWIAIDRILPWVLCAWAAAINERYFLFKCGRVPPAEGASVAK